MILVNGIIDLCYVSRVVGENPTGEGRVGVMDRRRFLLNALLTSGALLAGDAARAEVLLAAAKQAPAKPAPKPAAPRYVVALDPGHGGKDPGAIGRRGTYEKEITFTVASDLARRLEATGRYKVL